MVLLQEWLDLFWYQVTYDAEYNYEILRAVYAGEDTKPVTTIGNFQNVRRLLLQPGSQFASLWVVPQDGEPFFSFSGKKEKWYKYFQVINLHDGDGVKSISNLFCFKDVDKNLLYFRYKYW